MFDTALQLLVLMHIENQHEQKVLGFVEGRAYIWKVVDLWFSLRLDCAVIKLLTSECSC